MLILHQDDRLETALRHLGAHFYETRTKDRTGAAHMRAVATPGIASDVMPSWLVGETTTFSKSEYQRSERGDNEIKRRSKQEGENQGKGRGKGKKNGG